MKNEQLDIKEVARTIADQCEHGALINLDRMLGEDLADSVSRAELEQELSDEHKIVLTPELGDHRVLKVGKSK